MKHLIAVLLVASGPAFATGLTDPVVEPEVVEEQAIADAADIDGLVIGIWAATLLAAAGGAFGP